MAFEFRGDGVGRGSWVARARLLDGTVVERLVALGHGLDVEVVENALPRSPTEGGTLRWVHSSQVEQGRASWSKLDAEQQETVEELTQELKSKAEDDDDDGRICAELLAKMG